MASEKKHTHTHSQPSSQEGEVIKLYRKMPLCGKNGGDKMNVVTMLSFHFLNSCQRKTPKKIEKTTLAEEKQNLRRKPINNMTQSQDTLFGNKIE